MSNRPIQHQSGSPPGAPDPVGHAHFWERFLSRRRFMQTAGAAGVALGSGVLLPQFAWAAKPPVDPKPIPGTIPLPPPPAPPIGQFHFMFPGPADKGNEPSTITDFNGFIGGIDAVGSGTGTDTTTRVKTRLRWASDTRFMTGVYVGVDGKKHEGTFAFIWLDLYPDQSDPIDKSTQIHAYDPGFHPIIWTARISPKDVKVHLGEGKATLSVQNLAETDWKTSGNSLSMGKLLGPGVPATVSFEINWSGVTRKVKVRDAKNGFAGRFLETGATMTWSASQKSQFGGNTHGFTFVSDAARTTKTNFAEIGHERNGVFFDTDDDDDDDDD